MPRHYLILLVFVTTFPLSVQADVDPIDRAAAARTTMIRATTFMRSLATEGGYVYKYSPGDLSRRTAERPATETQIAIQPPGTPSMGMAFLKAYEVTKAPVYLEAARDAAEAIARCQLGTGGWNRTADFDPARPNEDGRLYHPGRLKFGQVLQHTLYMTFDDDTTQSAVRFLVAMGVATKNSLDPRDVRIAEARDRALRGMLRAQYPNGAWPQRYRGEPRDPAEYPVKKAQIPPEYLRTWPDADYTAYYTINDNVQSMCIETMLVAHRALGRPEYLESANRGAYFILLAQLPDPQPAWAQQYDHNMEPAWARDMEPPAVCSAESGVVIGTLLDMYLATGQRKFFTAAGRSVAWLKRSQIGPYHWARFYELGTNVPIYSDNGKVLYTPDGKFGYNWESAYKIPEVIKRYEEIARQGREAKRAAMAKPSLDLRTLESHVDQAIATCDDAGRWITPDRYRKGDPLEDFITTRTFIAQMGMMSAYLARVDEPVQHGAN